MRGGPGGAGRGTDKARLETMRFDSQGLIGINADSSFTE